MQLKLNENWDAAQRRFASFWAGENADRTLLQLQVRRTDGGPPCLAEAFPVVYIQQGGLPAMMGCSQTPGNGTVWTHPVDAELSSLQIVVDEANSVLRKMVSDIDAAARAAAGRQMVSFPANMGNVGDALAQIRGYENLCLDLATAPEAVAKLERQITECWKILYDRFYALTQPYVPGSCTQWLPIYFAGRCTLIEADFVCMVSARHFEEIYLPAIAARAEWAERSIYHLDGPDALRHLDALLSIGALDGIQWEPGAGSGSRLQWLSVLQKIQRHGKRLWVACELDEVETMLRNLSPKGLVLSVLGSHSIDTCKEVERLALERARQG
jgi:hypothetical protein